MFWYCTAPMNGHYNQIFVTETCCLISLVLALVTKREIVYSVLFSHCNVPSGTVDVVYILNIFLTFHSVQARKMGSTSYPIILLPL